MIGGCSQSQLTMIYRHLEITYASFAKVNLSTQTVPSWLQNPQGLPKASLSRTTGQDSTALLRWTWIPGCSNTLYTILSILAHIFPPRGFYVINVHHPRHSQYITANHRDSARTASFFAKSLSWVFSPCLGRYSAKSALWAMSHRSSCDEGSWPRPNKINKHLLNTLESSWIYPVPQKI